jgi:hypothetical protein
MITTTIKNILATLELFQDFILTRDHACAAVFSTPVKKGQTHHFPDNMTAPLKVFF